jgi:hypothetical protein
MLSIDPVITLNDHHLAVAGLADRKAVAVAAVRDAVGRMEGAHWIDVEAETFPAWAPGWVILYPCGRSNRPDTPQKRELPGRVEAMATAAVVAAWVPFRPQSLSKLRPISASRPPDVDGRHGCRAVGAQLR